MKYNDGKYIGAGSGYGGNIEIEVEILENKINDITVIAHNETKIISDPAFEHVIKNIMDRNTILVPNVSGCSMSSRGIREAVKNALIKAGADKEVLETLILESENLVKINAKKRTIKSLQKFDVVVVGGGGAGLSSAIAAADKGAKVVLLEKMNNLGGNTLVSMGGVNIPENDEQKENEIIDSKESFYNDIVQGGDQESNLDQVDILVQNALDTYRWLKEVVGVEFKSKKLIHFGGHKVPRASVFKGKYAIELISKLKAKALSLGVEIITGVDCNHLICDDKGRVVGIKAVIDEKEITFNSEYGVILATGGFSGNVEMRKKYNPKLDDRYKTTNVSGVTGHGHIMSEQVGAKFVHMNYIQTFPISNPNTGELSHVGGSRFDGAVLVNKGGKRFVEELERRDVVSENILAQEGQVAYLIWSREIEEIGNGTINHKAEVKRLMKDNLFGEFDTIEEGAEFFKIDRGTLRKTLEAYNNYVQKGKDEEFNRRGNLVSISEGPYYIQVVAPAVHHTMGGVKINNKNQVEKEDKTIIKGLYAAGEIVGGTHGTNRLGGNAITEVLVFGKRAGESIVNNK
ncbi:flavocytochrome c [Tepidibacter hydrothermalis]|uniref:Urocanate reductase n=1 Tax=Tepidibacter hydrothermalis TaxID=3036126 RepID=A0ABY8EBY4_9FIRM|nr:flavocytochrome c [Tepidibacter hydrothermalis]WFD09400.1 flavocytochrome c [Tepidibacter hydrothermalis]